MEIKLVEDQKQWDNFVAGQPFAQFLQSWAWGEFQKSVHRRVWRVGFFEDGKQVGAAQIMEHYLGLGWAYLYCPRGPIGESGIMNQELWTTKIIDFLKNKTSTYGEIFFRFEPSEKPLIPYSLFLIHRVPSVQPTHVFLLDLTKPEEELLKNMHEKTRYNIRLAERKGLELGIRNNVPTQGRDPDRSVGKSGINSDDFEKFWRLMTQTAKRDGIKLHPKKYYEQMLKTVPCFVLTIAHNNQWLAAGLFIGFGDTFTYVHGGSSNEHRELMAPYLMQWSAIKLAKTNGYRYYDFGGINPEETSDPDFRTKWTGITRFKKGFGGFVHSCSGTYDLPINNLGYKLYQILKKLI